uniref:MADF domain-containing protein n=1 Tax=Oryzias latipes TaxID=8090 RepID=A0A3P9L6D0_ORYLA
MMDDKLILAVFHYPELYNATLPNYRCTDSRANAWRNISIALGLPPEDCKRKWKNLRDRYLKEVRMETKNKRQGDFVQSKWRYRQSMNFIAPFTGSRGSAADICGEQDQENLDEFESGVCDPAVSGPSGDSAGCEDDELFLLSFVPALKRLAPQKRCETKMKIQQIMYEAEFNVALAELQEKKPEA